MPSVLLIALLLAGCDRIPTHAVDVDLGSASNSPAATAQASENLLEAVSTADAGESTDQPTVKVQESPPTPNTYIQALGTEPFWSISIMVGQMIYFTPENQGGTRIEARMVDDGPRMRAVGELDGKPFIVAIEQSQCSDGMSDTVYPLKATFTWGDRTEHGCARPR